MKTHIKAIFKGQDGSYGFKKNFEYDLWIESLENKIRIEPFIKQEFITLISHNYLDISYFLKNWNLIRVQ